MHLVCPECAATNRVPDQRLHEAPGCGRCHAPLMAVEPANLDDRTLPAFVAGTELPVLVDFWAAWCGPCKMMAPHLASAAQQLPRVRFAKVDTDASPTASARYTIRSIPTLILFDQGRAIARQSGAMQAGQLLAWLQQHLKQAAA